jgi:hypothetical protein
VCRLWRSSQCCFLQPVISSFFVPNILLVTLLQSRIVSNSWSENAMQWPMWLPWRPKFVW